VIIARRNNQTGAVHDPLQIAPVPPELGGPPTCRVTKASIAVALRNIAGSIFKLSSCFAFRDMNIVRMESRPSSVATVSCTSALTGRRHWDLIFYIDYEPSDNPAANRALLSNLREFSLWVHELGHYYAGLQEVEAAPAQWKEIIDVIAH
jgi:prephenate dehydratase/arogenate/prephenate dehydratase